MLSAISSLSFAINCDDVDEQGGNVLPEVQDKHDKKVSPSRAGWEEYGGIRPTDSVLLEGRSGVPPTS